MQTVRQSSDRRRAVIGARRIGFIGLLAWLTFAGLSAAVRADQPADALYEERARSAIERGLPLVEQAAGRYESHRQCFSCHHQTLPLLAMVSARHSGVAIDQELVKHIGDFTHRSFSYKVEDLRAGKNVGGKALTVAYGLWTLGLAGLPPDEVSEAMVAYLLKSQEADGHWSVHVSRPPMEDSSETTTVLSVIGLKKYAGSEQQGDVQAAISKARTWLDTAQPQSQEDRVSRLWSLTLLEYPQEKIDAARQAVLAAQRPDGGWAQLDTMESDAYATGQTLWVLFMTGTPADAEACRRGLDFLLDSQRDDGSWFVESRSKPVQVYFDNGDPHAKDQFISTPASCWALVALAMATRGDDRP